MESLSLLWNQPLGLNLARSKNRQARSFHKVSARGGLKTWVLDVSKGQKQHFTGRVSVGWYTNQKYVGPMLILVGPIWASPLLVEVALRGFDGCSGGGRLKSAQPAKV